MHFFANCASCSQSDTFPPQVFVSSFLAGVAKISSPVVFPSDTAFFASSPSFGLSFPPMLAAGMGGEGEGEGEGNSDGMHQEVEGGEKKKPDSRI